MDSHPNSSESLIQSSIKLGAAVDFLIQLFKKFEILALINNLLDPKDRLSDSAFSKYHGARFKPEYTRDINARTFTKIFKIIDPYMESVGHLFWDGKKYKTITAEQLEEKINPRLLALTGMWEAFSWDEGNTKFNRKGYIHHFKVKISHNKIICETLAGSFKGTGVTVISTDKLGIEIYRVGRRIYFILHVGNINNPKLHEIEGFKIAYIDSGEVQVKAGLALIKRSKKDYTKFNPTSKPVEEFSNILSRSEINYLRNRQLVIDSKSTTSVKAKVV